MAGFNLGSKGQHLSKVINIHLSAMIWSDSLL